MLWAGNDPGIFFTIKVAEWFPARAFLPAQISNNLKINGDGKCAILSGNK